MGLLVGKALTDGATDGFGDGFVELVGLALADGAADGFVDGFVVGVSDGCDECDGIAVGLIVGFSV